LDLFSLGDLSTGATAIAIYPDGRILLTGVTSALHELALARYMPDGSVDSGFGHGGMATSRISTTADDVELLADGRILVSGIRDGKLRLARFLPTGEPDPAFAARGVGKKRFGRGHAHAELALDEAGRIVVAASGGDITVIRTLADGEVDTSFSGDGQATVQAPGQGRVDVAVQPDGRIIVATGNRVARLVVTPGPADADADGLGDQSDRCPAVYAETTHGCPVEEITRLYDVSFKLGREGHFFGAITATSAKCDSEIYVRLYERRRGKDRFVGRGYTGASSTRGYFHVGGWITHGTYYVSVRGKFLDDAVRCRAFRSRNLRIR
jgi:uncharacterized delta-60 repeat protein